MSFLCKNAKNTKNYGSHFPNIKIFRMSDERLASTNTVERAKLLVLLAVKKATGVMSEGG